MTAFLPGAVAVVFLALISAGILRFLAPKIPFKGGFLMGLLGFGVGTLLLMGYYIAKAQFGFPVYLDSVAVLTWAGVAGTIITRQSREYGVERVGWFGVGGKVVLWIYLGSFAITAVVIAINAFKG